MRVTDEFLDYYNRELVFLRDMGDHFAKANPHVAGLLALSTGRCEDPHVERLMQSFAFLTARIRKKIDDEYPEITNALLSVVYPHYLRPLPSMTVVQFEGSNDPTKTVAGQPIPRGTPLKSVVASRGVRCQFQTAYPVTLWPLSVESAVMVPDRVVQTGKPAAAVGLLKLTLKCTAPGGWESLKGLRSIRFFLDGNEPIPSILYECLFSRLCEIWVMGKTADQDAFKRVLPREAVRPVGFARDEHLYPYPEHAFPGYRLLQEFFAFPQKYLFFDLLLNGPEEDERSFLPPGKLDGTIEIRFWLDSPPRSDVTVRPDNFRLGCTPAVNLFRWVPEPIPMTHLQTEYRVLADVEHPMDYEVFSVDRVVSSGSYLEEAYEFEPFYAMRHASRLSERTAYWFATRQPSLQDGGTEVMLSFSDSNFHPLSPAVEKITTYLTCSNRDLPTSLPFGGEQGCLEPEAEAAVGLARMLMKPTSPLRSPTGRSAQWRLISQLGLNHLSLMAEVGESDAGRGRVGAEPLRELLTLYDFAGTTATRKMIQGVLDVSHARIAARVAHPDRGAEGDPATARARRLRLLGKPLSLGLEIKVHFDEEAYPGAMAYLMATVLDRFLGAYVSINAFTQLVATSKQRQGAWRWPPRSGDRMLL
ncbi:MAG: type VI secretion system baseplate subunit TssF [Paludisphaera borealis]|uniref:type VI secretion system baseplate subunit TssF n=1 Tax=Paludisphaera borealis TaxID=1387353 RepID=UPI0028518771|nr:type VI secretion system baseplate subunit TssF [Paludisphaera borealis]MDR3618409.1 type VI secretion system baseplate subunit TssF [Paludisphaera borealis]